MFIFSEKKFENPQKIITAFDNESFKRAFDELQKLKNDFFLAGFISYRAKDVFLNKKIKTKTPLLYFEAHKNYKPYKIETPHSKGNLFIKENISFENYKKQIRKIKNYISKGTTYEVNYTFSNEIFCDIEGYELFLNLIQNQKTKYSAYIDNDFFEILSFSPELFFEIKNNKIITKPMKGTLKRKGDDKKEIDFLKNDIKNRAENTMIVDLLRNDLSKINGASNIKVEKLFEVETYKTLHQMTSTISAELETINLFNIFESLFPCGSITGAPKVSTMEIIDKIENYKRNIYCGAIGVISKNQIQFSVPIRIFEKEKNKNSFIFAQGGAIVWKSDAKDEWEECLAKKSFLTESIDFNLVETILIKNNEIKFLDEHITRLKKSAKKFGFKFSEKIYQEKFQNNKIARILLAKSGDYEIEYREIDEIKTNKIIISEKQVYSKNPFLYHKTDFKPWYSKSYEKIKKGEIFDTVFFNEKNELTEGSRSNIILKYKDILYTPKISSGLLDGIYRKNLLHKKQIREKTLYHDDLIRAEKIFLINSVRGILEAEL